MLRGPKPTGSTRPSKENKIRISSGRGGSGNIVPAATTAADLNHETELLRLRFMERKREEIDKYMKKQYTGRGGTGNIKAATVAQWISFDKSVDPDDSYEDIIVERNKQAPKPLRTGRGGSGNGLLKTAIDHGDAPVSADSRQSLSSSSNSSATASTSRLSDVSFASSSYISLDRRSSELSVFSRFAKFKQRERSGSSLSVLSDESQTQSRWRKSRRANTPSNCPSGSRIDTPVPQIVIDDCDFLECFDDNTAAILEVMERFEDDDGYVTSPQTPELLPSLKCFEHEHNSSEDTPDEAEEPDDGLDPDNQDARWERHVILQAFQYEVSVHPQW